MKIFEPKNNSVSVRCCVAGAGPAGMILAYLLARSGIDILVLEKHGDFLRDFRGDTIHPSTFEIMHELGLLDELLKRPHEEAKELHGVIGDVEVPVADFSHLKTLCKFIGFMPQWEFLNFIAEKARVFPHFHLKMNADVVGLTHDEHGVINGVKVNTPEGPIEVRADLTIGADGRHSTVRGCAGLDLMDIGSPIDVLWMRLSRKETDAAFPLGRFGRGRIFVMIYRGEYWQCGFVIPKGGIEATRARGLDAFRADIVAIAPFLSDRVHELKSWDDVKLLTVTVDRLKQWYRPGLLCIGDSAHAMSPVGGIGINLAIQDAVATANLLVEPLRAGKLTTDDLAAVQKRREWPTKITQRGQVLIQDRIIGRVLQSGGELSIPWALKLLKRFPILRRIPARLMGIGVRPEHVKTAQMP